MLLVFLLAACIGITLYIEMPRVAFEAERQKELLLIDRGNQFKRAIQVFVMDRQNNPTRRYPASVDELLSFNNHRYLRHKYVDPLTGKDEWRLVHTNGQVLTDSVLTQNTQSKDSTNTGSANANYIMTGPSMDASAAQGVQGGVNAARRARPSDSVGPPTGGPGGGDVAGNNQPGGTGMPGGIPGVQGGPGMTGGPIGGGPPGTGPAGPAGIAIIPPGATGQQQNGQPGQGQGGSAGSQPAQTCNAYIGGCAPTTPVGQPGGRGMLPGQPGNPVSSQTGGVSPYSTNPGSIGGQPGLPGQPGGIINPDAQGAAAGMINQILTSPRPGGMPTGVGGQIGTAMGGGIAGVASKFEAEGIMVINDRTAINEWEFIFDQRQYRTPPNPLGGGMIGGTNGQGGTTGPGGLGAPGSGGMGGGGTGTRKQ